MKIKTLVKHTLRLFYIARKTSFRGVTFKKANTIVWLKVWGVNFFSEDDFVYSFGIINALSRSGARFNIRFTTKIGKFQNVKVYFAYSRGVDPFYFYNYTQTLHFICTQLESQGCEVHPKSNEVLFWENKGYMTQKFFDLNISTPKTFLITSEQEFEKVDLVYPFLIKEEHSFSSYGLHKITKREDAITFFKRTNYFDKSKYLLVQELLDMRRDLRVILVGDKVVHHYWRINKSEEWKPTATSYGNTVDFGNFPEQWRAFIIDQFKRLNLSTGAFDIAWRNDDLSTPPLILEVSPNYQPNPAVDFEKMGLGYAQYKKRLLFRNAYEYRFVDIVFKIVNEQITYIQSQK